MMRVHVEMRVFITFSICAVSWSLNNYTANGDDYKSKIQVDHCYSKPCQNGGTCTNEEYTYNCTCTEFYAERDCSRSIWCEKLGKETCGNAKCEYNAASGNGTCICEDEKIFNVSTKACIVNYCAENPCRNGGFCRNDEDAYHCNCTGVYGGITCEDLIWCDKNDGTFMCGEANCVNDKILEAGYCACDDYKTFNKISKKCEAMSGCIPKLLNSECSKSNEICNDVSGECQCKANYKYNSNAECVANFCSLRNCGLNFKCKELGFGETTCVCDEGYFMGNSICIKIDPCSVKNCTQKCVRGVCGCEKGFILDSDNVTCGLENEESECDLDCGVVGTCIKSGTTSKCVCPSASFVSKNNKCIDYCTVNKKAPPYTCPTAECEPTNDIKGFRCKCKVPYALDEDGVHCKRKQMCEESDVRQKCEKDAALCRENLTNAEGYECYCDVGFEKEEGVCKRKCDIKINRDKCAAENAICELDDKMEVMCKCPPMLTRERNKQSGPCDTIATNSYLGKLSVLKSLYELKNSRRSKRSLQIVNLPKLRDDMTKSLKIVYDGLDDLKILDCDDDGNVLACSIEMQLPEKPEVVNKIASPTVCVPIDEEFCVVADSLVLKREVNGEDLFKKTEPCDAEVTFRLCEKATICSTPNDVDFQCRCRKGFYSIGSYKPVTSSKSFVERCNDIDECAIQKCPDTTYCVNTYGDYDCYCKDKYKKKRDNSDLKTEGCEALCSPSPCVNGTCVIVGNHGFSCKCNESFTGIFCNETVADPCTPNPCRNGGYCALQNHRVNCSCLTPYTGDFCERGPCTINPCRNGGHCYVKDLQAKCICGAPYSGEICEIESKLIPAVLMTLVILVSLLLICGTFIGFKINHSLQRITRDSKA